MEITLKEAYLVLTIPFVIAWLLIFLFSKKTRKEQLIMSLIFIPFGPLCEILYFKDYWIPQSIFTIPFFTANIFIEDIIFVFCIAGIGAVIYEVFFNQRLRKVNIPIHISALVIFMIAGIILIPIWYLGVNSIFSTSIGFLIITLLIVTQRRDLLLNSLFSGIGVMIVMFLSYLLLFNVIVNNSEEIFKQGWLLYGTRFDLRLWGIPLTEMIWGFCWGTMIGPLYEFAKRLKR
jgi:hypothetical protein